MSIGSDLVVDDDVGIHYIEYDKHTKALTFNHCTLPATSLFLTGSRAYGAPRQDSDWDVVLHTQDMDLVKQLQAQSPDPTTIRLGPLNIIVAVNLWQFAAWAEGTRICQSVAPVSRQFAKQVFVALGLKGGRCAKERAHQEWIWVKPNAKLAPPTTTELQAAVAKLPKPSTYPLPKLPHYKLMVDTISLSTSTISTSVYGKGIMEQYAAYTFNGQLKKKGDT